MSRRWGIGWANYIPGSPDTADSYELFAGTEVGNLLDGGNASLVTHSLNSPVLGRYTFGMVGGVTEGFSIPALNPVLAATGVEGPGLASLAALAGALGLGLVLVGLGRRRSTN